MENIKFAIDYLTKNSYKMLEDNNNYAVQSVKIGIEALEKQIRMPISDISEGRGAWKDGYCKCGHYVTDGCNYCHNCGQKLDWTDKE